MQPAAAKVERKAGSAGDVQARPPSLGRASTTRHSMAAFASRRPAAMPAAPPPTITTSVSLFAIQKFYTNAGARLENYLDLISTLSWTEKL